MQTLRVFCFGHFQIETGPAGDPTELLLPPTQKAQSLLAYLIIHRMRAHARTRLTGLFWRNRPDRRARRSLSTALWHIRRCFPQAEPIVADNRTVQFRWPGEVWLDSVEFRQAVQADDVTALERSVILYRGDFLEEFYDDWVIDERYRLHTLYLDGLARLMGHYHALGQPQRCLRTALTLLRHDPLREGAHRAAMRAYFQLGRRTDALAQYERCQQMLAAELGVEPTRETVTLRATILRAEPPSPAPSADLPPPLALDKPAINLDALPLVERDKALARLHGAWQATQQGAGRFLLLDGEAGVGKSRLLSFFGTKIREAGGQVLSGCCYEFERRLPYQPLTDAIRPVLAALGPDDEGALPEWILAELRRLAPGAAAAPSTPMTAADTNVLFHAFFRFLERLGQNAPVLLLLDDLHWANQGTLSLLHYLARHGRESPLLVLCTYRTPAPTDLARFSHQLRQDDHAEMVHLSRLSPDGVCALVGQIVDQTETVAPLADYLFAETEGNPFFISELLRSLAENGALIRHGNRWQADLLKLAGSPLPGGIKAAVANRLRRLPPVGRMLADVSAVAGRAFNYDLVRALWREEDEALLTGLDALLRAGLIHEADEWDYAFTHHKIQEVVYDALPRHRRLSLHVQAGRALTQMGEAQPAEVAHHLARGAQLDKMLAAPATAALLQAGEQAAAHFAYADALAYWQRALALAPNAAVRRQILLAREEVYHVQGARVEQARALDELETLPVREPAAQSEIDLRRARYAEATADFETAVAHIEQVLESGNTVQQGHARILLGDVLRKEGDFAGARSEIEQALPLVADRPKLRAGAYLSLGVVHLHLDNYEEAAAQHRSGLSIYRDMGDRRGEAYALNNLGVLFLEQARYEEARVEFARAAPVFAEIGDRRGLGMATANLGLIGMWQGNFAASRKYLQEAGALFLEMGDESNATRLWLALGMVLIKQLDLLTARETTTRSLEMAGHLGLRHLEGQALNNLGYIAAGYGQYDEARAWYRRSLMIKREIGDRRGECNTLTNLANVCRQQNDVAAALEHARAALVIARDIRLSKETADALTEVGFAQLAQGRLSEAAASFAEALNFRPEEAAPASGLAAVALAEGDPQAALAHMRPLLPMLAKQLPGNRDVFALFAIGCRVLAAAGEPEEAEALRDTAVSLLCEQAANITEPVVRDAFLHDIPAHHALLTLF